jgi:hypothetical protein
MIEAALQRTWKQNETLAIQTDNYAMSWQSTREKASKAKNVKYK